MRKAAATMWKPLCVLAGLIIGTSFGVICFDRSVVRMSATGTPLDLRGGIARCPRCPNGLAVWQQRGYDFRCEDCGQEYRLRWNADGEVEVDW